MMTVLEASKQKVLEIESKVFASMVLEPMQKCGVITWLRNVSTYLETVDFEFSTEELMLRDQWLADLVVGYVHGRWFSFRDMFVRSDPDYRNIVLQCPDISIQRELDELRSLLKRLKESGCRVEV
jgi:hypothetical protein